jgi:hypothetical protein
VVASIVALRTGSSATASFSEEELAEFETDLRKLGLEILHEEYDQLVPVFKPICPHCDFLPLCRKHPDFEEL